MDQLRVDPDALRQQAQLLKRAANTLDGCRHGLNLACQELSGMSTPTTNNLSARIAQQRV